MNPYYSDEFCTLLHGDCRDVLPAMPENEFDTCITDPPYELGFMGKSWDSTGVAFQPETWAAVLRVCKPGAMLLAFGGTRTVHRMTCAIEEAGWIIRDKICWLYGSGFPKSCNISKQIDKAAGAERTVIGTGRGKGGENLNQLSRNGNDAEDAKGCGAYGQGARQVTIDIPITAPATNAAKLWDGWGTALKPAYEDIIVAMKPLDGTFAANALTHGVAGLNIDGARIGTDRIPTRINTAIRNNNFGRGDGVGLQQETTIHSGRWPANIVLDEVAAELLDEQSGVLTSGRNPERRGSDKHRNVYAGWTGAQECLVARDFNEGGASRFFYTAKASKSDRGHGNTHATVKPQSLIKYLCTLTATPTGGKILDPFGGSMTTPMAARECGRLCVAIDIEESHCAIGVKRMKQGLLFKPEVA